MIGIGAFICLWISNDWQLHFFCKSPLVKLHLLYYKHFPKLNWFHVQGDLEPTKPAVAPVAAAPSPTSGFDPNAGSAQASGLAIDDMPGDGEKRYC